jgi:PAS domain S-box-containing protein
MGLVRRDIDELEYLSKVSVTLTELGDEQAIFDYVTRQSAELAPESLVITTRYEPRTCSAVVCAMAGPSEMLALGREVAGEPLGLELRVDDVALRTWAEGKLTKLPGGVQQLTFHAWPAELAREFERRLDLAAVFGQPFSRKGDYLGGVALLSRSDELEHARLIEAFVLLAAVAIQRRRAEAKLRESERRFRMLAENSRDIVFKLRLKPSPRLEYVNPITTRLTGYAPAELYDDPRLGAPCLYPEAWLQPEASRAEISAEPIVARCPRRDGTVVWMEQNFALLRDASGDLAVVEGISRDITKRKQAEEALLEADRRKSQFLAVLSHELRNPLGAIGNAVHVLGRVEPGSEHGQRALKVVKRQLAQLTRLIDDLLDVTRITRGRIELRREPLELGEIVRATAEDYQPSFAQRRIDFEVHLPPRAVVIDGDRTRITQILENLLHNAFKFAPSGGRASIALEVDHEAIVRVHNTGPPIPVELIEAIFEPFVQADQALARPRGGLGIGLALTKGLVDLHGGRLQVDSDESHGTRFTLHLPCLVDAAAAPPSPEVETSDGPSRRVLVIEDNEDAAHSLREALELYGHQVEVAGDGPEGIEAARSYAPEVVLCDLGLPRMDGYEVARRMRADPALRSLALVALSGYAAPEDVARASEAGFDRHMAKPPNLDELARLISELTDSSAGSAHSDLESPT